MTRDIVVDKHRWRIQLKSTGEIQFYYVKWVIPVLNSFEIGMLSWDETDTEMDSYEQLICSEDGMAQDVSPFKVKREIMKQVISLVKYKNFFHFKPTSLKRARIYKQLCSTLVDKLENAWEYQITDENQFCFNKKN